MATPLGQYPTLFAKHYCGQFHPKYNANVADLVKQANLSNWADLFRAKCGDVEIPARWGNADKPTLEPWVITEPYVGGATRVVMKRNPVFLAGRHRRKSTALYRSDHLQHLAGRRSR